MNTAPDLVGDRINWNKRVDEFVCRLAYEGVPIKAIQRALNLGLREVNEIIVDAMQRGAIAISPRIEWPLSSVDKREPAYFHTPVDDDVLLMACMQLFKITRLQAGVFLTLVRRRLCPREVLHHVTKLHRQYESEETNIKLIDVTICHLRKRFHRKKKEPPIFEIETVWAIGYAMTDAYRRKAAKMLLEYLDLNESYLSKIVME